MKESIVVEREFCDICGEASFYKCLGCKKDLCFEHGRNTEVAIIYPHSLFYDGSKDGAYCVDCDEKFRKDPSGELWGTILWNLYLDMAELRSQYKRKTKHFISLGKNIEERIIEENE